MNKGSIASIALCSLIFLSPSGPAATNTIEVADCDDELGILEVQEFVDNTPALSADEVEMIIASNAHASLPLSFDPPDAKMDWKIAWKHAKSPEAIQQEIKRRTQDLLNRRQISPQSENLREKLEAHLVLPAVLISTHLVSSFHNRFLDRVNRDPRFGQLPTILLAGHGIFRVDNPTYAAKGFVMYSQGGGLVYPVFANEYFLIGGNESQCLTRTVRDIIKINAANAKTHIKIRFISDLIYEQPLDRSPGEFQTGKLKELKAGTGGVSELNRVLRSSVLLQVSHDLQVLPATFTRSASREEISLTYQSLSNPNFSVTVVVE